MTDIQAIRELTERTKDFHRELALMEGKKEMLFHLFWHPEQMDVIKNVHPEALVFMLQKADKYANEEWARSAAKEIILIFATGGLVNYDHKVDVLAQPIVLTEEGEKDIRKHNLPPRPIELFIKEILSHKILILATILTIISGSISIYEFVVRGLIFGK